MGLDKSATIAIVLGLILLTAALSVAYKLFFCKRNRDLRSDELRTANTGQYHGNTMNLILILIYECVKLLVLITYGAQSFTSLMADIRVSVFSGYYLIGTFP